MDEQSGHLAREAPVEGDSDGVVDIEIRERRVTRRVADEQPRVQRQERSHGLPRLGTFGNGERNRARRRVNRGGGTDHVVQGSDRRRV